MTLTIDLTPAVRPPASNDAAATPRSGCSDARAATSHRCGSSQQLAHPGGSLAGGINRPGHRDRGRPTAQFDADVGRHSLGGQLHRHEGRRRLRHRELGCGQRILPADGGGHLGDPMLTVAGHPVTDQALAACQRWGSNSSSATQDSTPAVGVIVTLGPHVDPARKVITTKIEVIAISFKCTCAHVHITAF